MNAQITIVPVLSAGITGEEYPKLEVQCDRVGCGWSHTFTEPTSIEDVNTVAADHWAGHVADACASLLRIVRETVDDLRFRVTEVLGDAQNVGPNDIAGRVEQDAATTPQDAVSRSAGAVAADREAEAAERLQSAHDRVWYCADCGSPEVTVRAESDGTTVKCNACGAKRMLLPPYVPPFAGPPMTKRDDAGFERLPPIGPTFPPFAAPPEQIEGD